MTQKVLREINLKHQDVNSFLKREKSRKIQQLFEKFSLEKGMKKVKNWRKKKGQREEKRKNSKQEDSQGALLPDYLVHL